jgi:hypothetical protein
VCRLSHSPCVTPASFNLMISSACRAVGARPPVEPDTLRLGNSLPLALQHHLPVQTGLQASLPIVVSVSSGCKPDIASTRRATCLVSKRATIIRRSEEAGGATYPIGTDAAGEAVNLQFCWLMVNYDLPWNPARLEQRMGRIHRYGEKKESVYIANLVATFAPHRATTVPTR